MVATWVLFDVLSSQTDCAFSSGDRVRDEALNILNGSVMDFEFYKSQSEYVAAFLNGADLLEDSIKAKIDYLRIEPIDDEIECVSIFF